MLLLYAHYKFVPSLIIKVFKWFCYTANLEIGPRSGSHEFHKFGRVLHAYYTFLFFDNVPGNEKFLVQNQEHNYVPSLSIDTQE